MFSRQFIVKPEYDVIVIGGGNAGLCAALSARERGSRVLLLERAPQWMRAGNTRHTRNIRCVNSDPRNEYGSDEFFDDLLSVTGPCVNPTLAKFAVEQSKDLPQWMSRHGVHWQPALAGTLHLSRTNRWFLGGGKALANAYYGKLQQMGVEVQYDACVTDLHSENDRIEAVVIREADAEQVIRGRAVVVSAGGFEANLPWLREYWGEAADNFCVRGTPYNDGALLRILLSKQAMQVGDPKSFHWVAIDARAPKYDGGIVTRLDAIPFGIVVNRHGKRFYDEGEEIWPKRYASWGRLIAEQPGQIAYCLLDSKTITCFLPPMHPPLVASSLEELGRQLDVDGHALADTIRQYNCGTQHNLQFRPSEKDGVQSRGIDPPKSNWALPLDKPPYYALPLRTGITFTYMGVAVDEIARVINRNGRPFQNLYAAGEIMAGNILKKGYLAGFGLTIGSVFGRLAGREAAKRAVN
jgi:tricarballylate dehydrogenase